MNRLRIFCYPFLLKYFLVKGNENAKRAATVRNPEMGLVKKTSGLLLDISIEVIKDFSEMGPRMMPKIKGATGKSSLSSIYPNTPMINMTHTSNILLLSVKDPTTHKMTIRLVKMDRRMRSIFPAYLHRKRPVTNIMALATNPDINKG